MDNSGMLPPRTRASQGYRLIFVLLLISAMHAISASANPNLRHPDPSPTSGLTYCYVYTRYAEYKEYLNNRQVSHPTLDDLEVRRKVPRGIVLHLNQAQCADFNEGSSTGEFFASLSNRRSWYRKSEFIQESELVPLDRWTTRYIYNNSYLSHVGSESTTPVQEKLLDLFGSYASYSLPTVRKGLIQYSDDGYISYAGDGGGRWRIMRHPNMPPTASELDPRLYVIDESGRHLPNGLHGPSTGSQFGYSCSVYDRNKYSCGFGPRPGEDLMGVYFFGHINQFMPQFSPLKISADRVTIRARVSKGEPFKLGPEEWAVQDGLFLYADFEDPIRSVYFASGLILKDPDKLSMSRSPEKSDFVQHEICLTDCAGDIAWQYGSRRRRDEGHP